MPILLSLGPIKLYSYGVFLVIGLFLSLYFWWKMGRDEHWEEITLFDGFFLSLLTYFVFGRVGYSLLHPEAVGTLYRLLAILAYPGISAVTGIVAVIICMILFARSQEWQVWKALDALVVSLSMVLFFGGIGGLLNGSFPGKALSWGMLYPGETVKRIPLDVLVIVWALFTFALVSRVRKNFRFYSWYKGEASTAQEGLAAHFFGVMVGVYYVMVGWMDQMTQKVWIFPVEFLLGLGIVLLFLYLIKQRSGKHDTGGTPFAQLRLSLLQWARKGRM